MAQFPKEFIGQAAIGLPSMDGRSDGQVDGIRGDFKDDQFAGLKLSGKVEATRTRTNTIPSDTKANAAG